MKSFPILYQVTWVTCAFSLVTMATILVPKDEDKVFQMTSGQQSNQQISSFNPSTISPSQSLVIHSNDMVKHRQYHLSTTTESKLSPNNQHPTLPHLHHQKCSNCDLEPSSTILRRPNKNRLKRSAMLLNKIVSALHKAMDNNNKARSNRVYLDSYQSSLSSSQQMDLTRRIGSKKMFRKCYFNPVACF